MVQPSGRPVTLSVIEVHHWRDGQLSRMVNYQDAMARLVQVGAVAAPVGL